MMPFVVLYDNNIEEVAEKTGRTKEDLEEALKFYKGRGIYPVKVPLLVKSSIFETYGKDLSC